MTLLDAVHAGNSDRYWKWGLGAASLAVVALVWQVLAIELHSLLLPTFTDTVVAFVRLASGRELWRALWISNQAAGLGFFFGSTSGILIGVITGRWRAAEKVVDPYLNILLAVPKAALIPVLIMATGLGLFSRVLIVFSFSVVSVAVNTRAGLRLVDQSWIDMAQVFGAGEMQLWRKVLLPAALPGIISGLRLGLIRSVSGMIAVELLLLALGVGRLILDFQGTFQAANLYATILMVVAEAVLLIQVFNRIERRALQRVGQAVVE
jgi:ABC-type nitrate/sulfonate/bicarbonate transport system permease component